MPKRELPMAGTGEHTCLLAGPALQERIGQWRALAGSAFRQTRGPGVITSVFPSDDEIADTLRTLIDAEAACCSFLSFDVRERATEIEVELRYPDGFDIDAIFGRA